MLKHSSMFIQNDCETSGKMVRGVRIGVREGEGGREGREKEKEEGRGGEKKKNEVEEEGAVSEDLLSSMILPVHFTITVFIFIKPEGG